MSYRENLYKNALKIIEQIYQQSKYDPSVDLYRSFDVMNAVNDPQLDSKEWLVNNLLPFINKKRFWPDTNGELKDILVMGSWYSVIGMILKNHINIPSVTCGRANVTKIMRIQIIVLPSIILTVLTVLYEVCPT